MPGEPTIPNIQSIHHLAFRCRDAVETRKFYEDIVGLEFAGAVAIESDPRTGQQHEYVHIFFKMQDGNFIALFDDPASATPEQFQPRNPFDTHFAMGVDTEEELMEFKAHLEANGLTVVGPLDHDFVLSIYTYDPNGVPLEITWKVPDHDGILDASTKIADRMLADWSAKTAQLKSDRIGDATATSVS